MGRGKRNTLEPGQHVSELSNSRTFNYRLTLPTDRELSEHPLRRAI
jgi:hypothetical protein